MYDVFLYVFTFLKQSWGIVKNTEIFLLGKGVFNNSLLLIYKIFLYFSERSGFFLRFEILKVNISKISVSSEYDRVHMFARVLKENFPNFQLGWVDF